MAESQPPPPTPDKDTPLIAIPYRPPLLYGLLYLLSVSSFPYSTIPFARSITLALRCLLWPRFKDSILRPLFGSRATSTPLPTLSLSTSTPPTDHIPPSWATFRPPCSAYCRVLLRHQYMPPAPTPQLPFIMVLLPQVFLSPICQVPHPDQRRFTRSTCRACAFPCRTHPRQRQ